LPMSRLAGRHGRNHRGPPVCSAHENVPDPGASLPQTAGRAFAGMRPCVFTHAACKDHTCPHTCGRTLRGAHASIQLARAMHFLLCASVDGHIEPYAYTYAPMPCPESTYASTHASTQARAHANTQTRTHAHARAHDAGTHVRQSRATSRYSRCARTDKGVSALGQVRTCIHTCMHTYVPTFVRT